VRSHSCIKGGCGCLSESIVDHNAFQPFDLLKNSKFSSQGFLVSLIRKSYNSEYISKMEKENKFNFSFTRGFNDMCVCVIASRSPPRSRSCNKVMMI
jgi:hypothetical protein